MATVTELMTTEEMLALPKANVERWLVEGELREKPMTVRNRFHSRTQVCIDFDLERWRREDPESRGFFHSGEAGVRLQRNPDTTYGIDVVYISPEVVAQQTDETTLIDGVPTLAVEILSFIDTVEEIEDKVQAFLKAGIPHIWIVNPYRKTVTVYRPNQQPTLANIEQCVDGEPQMPGLRVAVSELFA